MQTKRILNWIGLIVVLVVNGLATALPINGLTTAEISDSIPTLFTPAGYVFSIWGVIYLLLLAFAWYQTRADGELHDRIGYWFAASCAFNSAWILAWHYQQFALSLLIMLGLLVTLLAIYLRLEIGQRQVSSAEKRWVHVPFGTYLGWISVATVANVSAVLYLQGWTGAPLNPELWTVIMVIVAAVLGLAMIQLRREVAYPLVIIWALVGIAVARSDMSQIALVAGGSALVVAAWLLVQRLRGAQGAAV
jgi:benzodiazapine receptor